MCHFDLSGDYLNRLEQTRELSRFKNTHSGARLLGTSVMVGHSCTTQYGGGLIKHSLSEPKLCLPRGGRTENRCCCEYNGALIVAYRCSETLSSLTTEQAPHRSYENSRQIEGKLMVSIDGCIWCSGHAYIPGNSSR